ncbi:NAD(P)H-hydrate dehydratase [Candidatus Woesearchaeota archaeon]|nr:NAD(P)H-hydrate dehydratase [Candidatus Woesearchaeota archaeon]
MKIKLKKRKKTSHKGQNGEALIIGGSEDYAGCLALAGLAALRTGIDWVTIAAPEKVGWAVQSLSPDLVVKKFRGTHFTKKHVNPVLKLAKQFDAVLIGNGIGRKSDDFVKQVVKKINKPLVIDADGVKAVKIQDAKNAILTPHKKELEILLKNSNIKEKELQKKIGDNVFIIKGHVDKIISKNRTSLNRTGNEGMTVGGTGDVLAGLALGFLAQKYPKFESARIAAFINGKLGDQLKKKKGYSFIASDLVEDLKKIQKKKRF